MKSNSIKAIGLLTLAVTVAACGRTSTPPAPIASVPDQFTGTTVRNAWFIELSGQPGERISAQTISSQQASFRRLAAQRGIRYQEVHSYSTLFNGFSVRATDAELARLRRLPDVVNVFPVVEIERPQYEAASSEPEMYSARGMTGADFVNNELGLTGKGVRVAVMDSGIDNDHPAFAGRLSVERDYVGDAFGSNGNTTPVPDEDADDCNGHGTHVAGIVGGNDASVSFKGVAPEVTFGAYKVFGCDGGTNADIMLEAMEDVASDGMQVLNMSIGAAYQWPQYPTARGANALVKRGVVVVTSAGNSGANGTYSVSAPGAAEKVIATASLDNVTIELNAFALNPGNTDIGYVIPTGTPTVPTSGTVEIAATGTPATTDDACAALPEGSLTGKVALIRRGSCTFRVKALNAQAAGAVGVIAYNNAFGYITGITVAASAGDNSQLNIPVVLTSAANGATIYNQIQSGVTSMTWKEGLSRVSNPVGGSPSSFTSYGMAPDLTVKPDIAAPGGAIKSAWPLDEAEGVNGYNTISGTSMAAPHVAGAAALLLQARPTSTVEQIRTLLQNNANPILVRGSNGALLTDVFERVQRQGAGLLNITASVVAPVNITPTKLALGESDGAATKSKVLVLRNDGPAPMVYTVTHVPAQAVGGTTFVPTSGTASAAVTINGAPTTTVTVPAFGEAEVSLTITAPTTAQGVQYGGYVKFVNKVGGAAMTVPYAGFVGDYQAIRVLGPVRVGSTNVSFPVLSQAGNFAAAEPTYTLTPTDQPTVWAHFAHQAQRIALVVKDENGQQIADLGSASYWGRNATNVYAAGADNWDVFTWDGKTDADQDAPAGKYRFVLTVLKALGDESNPAHTETWESPLFNIARP